MSDIELLRDYALRGSEPAFAELVQRHIRLVYSVAFRQLGNRHQAEEVTQAVFIIFARKAAGFPADTPFSGWLYQTARLTTANLLRSELRRHRREQEAHMQSEIRESPTEPVWQKLAPVLDEAMGQLSAKERDAIVVRYFEGCSFSEVALALGSSEAAVQKRVGRGIEKLRALFAKRGIKLSSGVLVGLITANSLQSAPIGLTATVTASAVVKGAAASGSTLTLIKGALKLMAWAKMKTTLVVGACVLLAAGITTVAIYNHDRPLSGIPKDWSVMDGSSDQWMWANNAINGRSIGKNAILASSKRYDDVTVSAITSTTNRDACIAFRMQDPDNGYLVVFVPDGTPWANENGSIISLVKKAAGQEQEIASFKRRGLPQSAKLTVVARGPQIEVSLNDAVIMKARDFTFASGFVGLRVFGDPIKPCDGTFSNLTVR